MKRISIALAAIVALCLCCYSFGKDVKISKADNDKIVSCSVGDVLVVSFVRGAQVSCDSGSGLCLKEKQHVRGKYLIDVEKAGKCDLSLKRCYGGKCVSLLVHIDASEAKKEKPKK